MNVLKEEDVLKPALRDEDPDDWPCHILREAIIYSQDGESLVNLLEAELHGPFLVQGKLEVEKQHKSCIIHKPRNRIVEVSSDLFSIGDGPEGVTIWAGGKGGWFEIIPSSVYREEYDKMAAAVRLYYTILDYITETKKSRKNALDVAKIFDAYSAKEHESTLNQEEVAELCKVNGIFLLSMMRRPATAKQWKSTPIFKWLTQQLPDVIPQLESSNGSRGPQNVQELKLSRLKNSATLPIRQSQIPSRGYTGELDQVGESSSKGRLTRRNAKDSSSTVKREVDLRPRGSRKSGKGAGLRLATPGKRPHTIIISDGEEDDPTRLRKRQRSMVSAADDEEDTPIEEPNDDLSVQDDEDDEDEENDEGEEEKTHQQQVEPDEEDIDVEEQLQLSLESVKIPSFEASGPDGLWTCPKKGCEYFVHGAEDEDIQEQIREHFLKHAENIRIQLARFKAVKQESRPHLPINHLLEKLRRLGEASRLAEEAGQEKIDGKLVPKPIKRKLPA